MRFTPAHAQILESRLDRRLARIGAERIALLGAGRFAQGLLACVHDERQFANAQVVALIDESRPFKRATRCGVPVVGAADEAPCDAIVIATAMHEPAMLRRAAKGDFGSTPVIGMHTTEDPDEMGVDVLLLPETAWFGLDLPGLLAQSDRSCTIASATGLPGFDEIETKPFWEAHEGSLTDRIAWKGMDLFEIVRGSAACLLGRVNADPVADRQTIVALMDETIRIYESALLCFSSQWSPGVVVVANGLLHHQRAMAEAALRCGKLAVAIESSCFPGLCRLDLITNRIGARSVMRRSTRDRIEGRVFTKEERARTTAYLRDRVPHTERRNDSASQPLPGNVNTLREQLRIPEGHRALLLLGQVCTDTALVYEAAIINDVPELARIAAGVIAETPRWTLIIKPHPKEATGADPIAGKPYRHGAFDRLLHDPISSQPGVRLVGPAEHNVYDLMRLASAGLTINSQSALEMTSMYAKPVCLVGGSAFGDAGLTRVVERLESLAPTLRALLDDPARTPREHDRSLQHVDHAVFENLIPTEVRTPEQALTRDNDAIHVILGERVGRGVGRPMGTKQPVTMP